MSETREELAVLMVETPNGSPVRFNPRMDNEIRGMRAGAEPGPLTTRKVKP
ncbi:hypothetical protein LCGC14_2293780 [marine sediment metagenome]|uniref:Uncharacterized protein n=1 Tax=marine sediment metagenome TaxID=412755 RepID=A0A0F9CQF7_9ZZZZ